MQPERSSIRSRARPCDADEPGAHAPHRVLRPLAAHALDVDEAEVGVVLEEAVRPVRGESAGDGEQDVPGLHGPDRVPVVGARDPDLALLGIDLDLGARDLLELLLGRPPGPIATPIRSSGMRRNRTGIRTYAPRGGPSSSRRARASPPPRCPRRAWRSTSRSGSRPS